MQNPLVDFEPLHGVDTLTADEAQFGRLTGLQLRAGQVRSGGGVPWSVGAQTRKLTPLRTD